MPVSRRQQERQRSADEAIAAKVAWVKSQGQTRDHHCHWPGCDEQVPPAMWGCKRHWFKLPKQLRDRIWATYKPGQEVDMTPSLEYLDATGEAERWIIAHCRCIACSGTKLSSKGERCYPCKGSGVAQ